MDAVLDLEDKYMDMSDHELQQQTQVLKERLADGETTDDILPDAFAVCREATRRVLGTPSLPGTDYRRYRAPSGTYCRNEDR